VCGVKLGWPATRTHAHDSHVSTHCHWFCWSCRAHSPCKQLAPKHTSGIDTPSRHPRLGSTLSLIAPQQAAKHERVNVGACEGGRRSVGCRHRARQPHNVPPAQHHRQRCRPCHAVHGAVVASTWARGRRCAILASRARESVRTAAQRGCRPQTEELRCGALPSLPLFPLITAERRLWTRARCLRAWAAL
jgi:hypothetical protein